MKRLILFCAALISLLALIPPGHAEEQMRVAVFSPQGMIKQVRQVSVRFSSPMVSFGDPRTEDPFDIACSEKGRGRWADSSNWVYDFDRDLPGGVICEFSLKKDLKTISGVPLAGQQVFSFSTGGPTVLRSYPSLENSEVTEDQIFVLELDAEADEGSLLSHVSCELGGINERVGIRLVKGREREQILQQYRFLKDRPVILLQCRQTSPANSPGYLVWGKGVSTPGGVMTTEDRRIEFRVRAPFTAEFSCSRENARAGCIPVLPMRLNFSSPIAWDVAGKILLKGGAKTYRPERPAHEDEGDDSGGDGGVAEDESLVQGLIFKGPFPENGSFTIELPNEVTDDAGRPLSNMRSFPLAVKTAANPPLAKFAARFGIIELKGDATLPVTVRSIEPEVRTKMLKVEKPAEGAVEKTKEVLLDKTRSVGEAIGTILPDSLRGKNQDVVDGLRGRLHKLRMGSEEQVIVWLKKVMAAKREKTIFSSEKNMKSFSVPRPGGARAFEVIGLPLKAPGLYVVEMESQLLGRSLLGKQAPMFVQTAALVTNLSAHFKWGMESSLVWVTTLDKGEPVKEAAVSLRDCNGKQLWVGKTDTDGIARIPKKLPAERGLPVCAAGVNYEEATQALRGINRGLFVFATSGHDMTFVHSSWEEGIEPWRYNMPDEGDTDPVVAHTVLDRSLLRAGETVHMKHLVRRHATTGLSIPRTAALPGAVLIRHSGSDQKYELPLAWDRKGSAETQWTIPKEASLGHYTVTLVKKKSSRKNTKDHDEDYPEVWESGSFRVEEFRVPLMKAVLLPPKAPLVRAAEAAIDLQVSYLSGGGAKNAAVKLRSQTIPKSILLPDYEDFVFANGELREEKTRRLRSNEGEAVDSGARPKTLASELTLDSNGGARTKILGLPPVDQPHDILAELEFRDPNGEVQTVSQRIPLWPSKILVGIKPDSWASSRDSFRFHAAVVDLEGRPVPDRPVMVDLFQRKSFSHRKRLVGGFYAYEHTSEIKKVGRICEGKTDARGLLICEVTSPVSGNVILQAESGDDAGNASKAHRDVWIVGKGEWWFDVSDHDRIDLIPEKKKYEPGETAKFQVRMPFREATALISVEREGIVDTYVRKISGKHPVIEVPVKQTYAPNVFVSVLVVRGRVDGVQPTALVDLGKPAFRLGLGEITVGWKAFALRVHVAADRQVYETRDTARVKVRVLRADGKIPPKGSEIALAAVDEGLLELMSNKSWNLIEAMMGRRSYRVRTATAQMQVVGKRHYGLKAQPQGGGGGRQASRELFDTLLFWKARIALNEKGEAEVEVPLNDSLTSFRIVAVATGGAQLFGTGQTSIRTSQELMLLSSLPTVVREGDRFFAGFTLRNASDRNMDIEVKAVMRGAEKKALEPVLVSLAAGEAREIGWKINVPAGVAGLTYDVSASEKGGDVRDSISVKQRVAEAVPVRTFQSTLAQVDGSYQLELEKPREAIAGKGGISVSLRPKISGSLAGVARYMKKYPYTCMEQKVSRAVSLRDETLWKAVIAELPAHLDGDGLVKYFPLLPQGNDSLTAYVLAISNEAGWPIPEDLLSHMEEGLRGFVEGRVLRYSLLPSADLSIRKIAALAALARTGKAELKMLGSINLEPNLWPTSALIDWTDLLLRMKEMPDREKKITEAGQILRARMNFQGTTLGFSTERSDRLWWLMVSPDLNAVKSILTLLQLEQWNPDMPRLLRAALGRQHRGAWDLTTANAWGVLAVEKFSKKFESTAVSGMTSVTLGDNTMNKNWTDKAGAGELQFGWPQGRERMLIRHVGAGRPWATVQSLAAIPLKEPLSTGYRIKKTLIPVEQKTPGVWSKGDVVRVRLEVEAQADMTWVVLNDPIPSGSLILGTGLGRDSQIMTTGEKHSWSVWPAFEERSFEAFRAYYEFAPKGSWTVEYTVRLNNSGVFHLPASRVEAMYAPEAFGEIPNKALTVEQ